MDTKIGEQTGGLDRSDMKSVLRATPRYIKEAYDLDVKISLTGKPSNIIICGMGGSSIAGQILESFCKGEKIKTQIINVQNYSIPAFTDKNSLIIISSYSGNTEESISCYREAFKNNFNMIIMSSGGKLAEMAQTNKIPHIRLPSGLQPRNAIVYSFFPLLKILESAGIIDNRNEDVSELIRILTKNNESYEKSAFALADKLYGTIPVVYASDNFFSVAYRWKCEFNENTKIPSFCNKFPELNHNELISYINYYKLNTPLHILILKDENDHRRILKRMDISKRLIKEMTEDGVKFTEVLIKGESLLSRIFTTIYLGDFISYYLALKYNTDPTPVDIIEKFKKELGPFI